LTTAFEFFDVLACGKLAALAEHVSHTKKRSHPGANHDGHIHPSSHYIKWGATPYEAAKETNKGNDG